MKKYSIVPVLFLLFVSGCATSASNRQIQGLKGDLNDVSRNLELAKKENLSLKRELALFKEDQNIDSHRFVVAHEIFSSEFAPAIKDGDVSVEITDKGLIISILSENLFVSASDALSEAGKDFLDEVAVVVNRQFPNNFIYIEGHTDNQSLAVFEWKSDWEFSFARALSVLKYFTEKKDFDPLRLSAAGFGQYRPRVSNNTKEGRSLNRRIEIVISPQRLMHP